MQIQPYLFFDGRAEEAIAFYTKAIGAKPGMMMRFKDNPDKSMNPPGNDNKVMHATVTIGDSLVMLSDGHAKGKPNFDGFALSLDAKDDAGAKKLFDGLADGGQVTTPLTETFFATSFGMVKDRFGVHWMVIKPKH